MKRIVSIAAFLCFGLALQSQAQVVKKAENAIDTAAHKVGHKTAEVASKGKAKLTDEVYKDAIGPGGEIVYIDNHSRYYWIDKKGHRHYAEKSALKPKTE